MKILDILRGLRGCHCECFRVSLLETQYSGAATALTM